MINTKKKNCISINTAEFWELLAFEIHDELDSFYSNLVFVLGLKASLCLESIPTAYERSNMQSDCRYKFQVNNSFLTFSIGPLVLKWNRIMAQRKKKSDHWPRYGGRVGCCWPRMAWWSPAGRWWVSRMGDHFDGSQHYLVLC